MSSELFRSARLVEESISDYLASPDSWINARPNRDAEIQFDEDCPEYDPRYFTEPVYRIKGRIIEPRTSPDDPIDPEVVAFYRSITPMVQMEAEILGGMPVFKGTLVPIKTMFDYLLAHKPMEEFLRDYPAVPAETARAVLENDATLFYEEISKKLSAGGG